MFGEPEAPETPALGMLRKIERIAQRMSGIGAFGDRRKIEDGEWNHCVEVMHVNVSSVMEP